MKLHKTAEKVNKIWAYEALNLLPLKSLNHLRVLNFYLSKFKRENGHVFISDKQYHSQATIAEILGIPRQRVQAAEHWLKEKDNDFITSESRKTQKGTARTYGYSQKTIKIIKEYCAGKDAKGDKEFVDSDNTNANLTGTEFQHGHIPTGTEFQHGEAQNSNMGRHRIPTITKEQLTKEQRTKVKKKPASKKLTQKDLKQFWPITNQISVFGDAKIQNKEFMKMLSKHGISQFELAIKLLLKDKMKFTWEDPKSSSEVPAKLMERMFDFVLRKNTDLK